VEVRIALRGLGAAVAAKRAFVVIKRSKDGEWFEDEKGGRTELAADGDAEPSFALPMRIKQLPGKKQSVLFEVYAARAGGGAAASSAGALAGFEYLGEAETTLGAVLEAPGHIALEKLGHREADKLPGVKGWIALTGIVVTDELTRLGDVQLQLGVRGVELGGASAALKPDPFLMLERRPDAAAGDAAWTPSWMTEPRRGAAEATFAPQRVPVWTLCGGELEADVVRVSLMQWTDGASGSMKSLGVCVTSMNKLAAAAAAGAGLKFSGGPAKAAELIVAKFDTLASAFASKKKAGAGAGGGGGGDDDVGESRVCSSQQLPSFSSQGACSNTALAGRLCLPTGLFQL
jgi:hypothetical protein